LKNTGKEFESLSYEIFTLLSKDDRYSNVQLDVLLDSPDGQRQFDVVINSRLSGLDILTVIECRDYAKNLSVSNVDGFYSKMQDVNANKGVIVARKGFSKTAKQKADRLGITLCTAHDYNRKLEDIGLQVPITFISLDSININLTFTAQFEANTSIKPGINNVLINEIPLLEFFQSKYKLGEIESTRLNEELSWSPKLSKEDNVYILDTHDNKIEIEKVEITYNIVGLYYCGYVHNLPNTIGINNLSDNQINMFINSNDILIDYKHNLKEYKSHKSLPKMSGTNLIISDGINFNDLSKGVSHAQMKYVGPPNKTLERNSWPYRHNYFSS